MTVKIDATSRNDMAVALATAMDTGTGAGKLAIYTGSQPATAATAASGTKLLEFTCNDPMFDAASGAITLDISPTLSTTGITDGTAGYARFVSQDGNRRIDGAVGSEVTLSDTTVETGQTYTVTSAVFTVGGA